MFGLENMDVPTIITWMVTVAIPTGLTIWKTIQAKGLKGAFKAFTDLMIGNKPMDDNQTALIKSGKVDDKTWKMSKEAFAEMCAALERRDILIDKVELWDLINQIESEYNVDYGILICGKDGNPDDSLTHLYISYGTPMYQTRAEVEHNAKVNSSKIFSIKVHWYLTNLRKMLLLSEMGCQECVDAAVKKIELEEQKQTESYELTCKDYWWLITRGKVVSSGRKPKD